MILLHSIIKLLVLNIRGVSAPSVNLLKLNLSFLERLGTERSCAFKSESSWLRVFPGKLRPKTGKGFAQVHVVR